MTLPAFQYEPGMTIGPGVYFGMPFAEYDKIPALRASKLSDLMASPALFYRRHIVGDIERPQSAAMLLGQAIHTCILEGRGEYGARFCIVDGLAKTVDEIRALASERLPDLLLKSSMKKGDLIDAILTADPALAYQIDETARAHAAARGVSVLSNAEATIVHAAAETVAALDISELIESAWPEVTVVWLDEYGTQYATRFDKLGMFGAVELKTRMRREGEDLGDAALRLMARNYRMQMALHLEAMEQIGDAKTPIGQPVIDAMEMHYLFVHQDACPDAVCYTVSKETAPGFCSEAAALLDAARARYYDMRAKWGSDRQWRIASGPIVLWDDDLPAWMTGGATSAIKGSE